MALSAALLLSLTGCDRARALVGMGPKAAAVDGGATLAKASAADGGAAPAEEADPEQHDRDRDGGHGPSHGDEDVDVSYTPRRRPLDAEDCDEVAKEVLERLKEQSEKLAQRGAEVKQREKELQVQKEALGKLRKEVEAQSAELRGLLARLDAQPQTPGAPAQQVASAELERRRGEQVKITSALVAGMPPAKAAAVLAALKDAGLAAQVLQSLPSEQSGRVLAAMRPEVAARLMEREREVAQP